MKKIICFLLAVLLLIPIMNQMTASAAANDGPTFAVSMEQASRGEKVSVAIRIENNTGVASIKLKAKFDSGLVLNSVTYNKALGGRSQQPETFSSPVTLNWFNGEANTTGDMIYATLNFTVSKKASVGKHTVSITYDQDDVYNIDEDNIPFKTVSGGVNVTIPVTGIALDQTHAVVKTGDKTYTLNPVFTPTNATDQNVTWSSSDETVATVDGGVVTLLKKGETVITVKSNDGGFEASCVLNIQCSHLTCEEVPAEPATCTKTGREAYTVCKDCGEIISGGAVIDKLAHTPAASVRENVVPASCTKAGSYDRVVYCKVCGEEISRTHKTIPATGHTYGDPEWIWNGYEEATAVFTCAKGDDQISISADITISITKRPSLTEDGELTYRAAVTFEGKAYTSIKTVVLPRMYIIGDVDDDGEATALDATVIQRCATLIYVPYPEQQLMRGDVDDDGELTALDATFIQRYATHFPVPYPIGDVATL